MNDLLVSNINMNIHIFLACITLHQHVKVSNDGNFLPLKSQVRNEFSEVRHTLILAGISVN